MRKLLSIIALFAIAACGGTKSGLEPVVPLNDFGTFNAGRIEIVVTGGFAALWHTEIVTHDDRRFVDMLRQICTSKCAAPLDSASGTLSAAATDSLFNIALANIAGLKDDYGTPNVATDAGAYRLTVSNISGTKTVVADDVTMPPPMRAIVDAVRGTISAARK